MTTKPQAEIATGDWQSGSAQETFALGERLGSQLGGGEILLLDGPLGAGKTVFVKGIAAAFVAERVGLAAQAYSSAQRCLDLTVEWCRNRETFGKPLISRQQVQNTLAEMARRLGKDGPRPPYAGHPPASR